MSINQRKFLSEISALVDANVSVAINTGKTFTGKLLAIDPNTLSLCLEGVHDESGSYHRVILNGDVVTQILSVEEPFNLKALAQRLEKVFPTLVSLYEDKRFIWVMNKVKVTEKGVIEGSGPAADRVQRVYELFTRDLTK